MQKKTKKLSSFFGEIKKNNDNYSKNCGHSFTGKGEKMSKRGESIWKRKDGRWEGRYIKDRTIEGKAIYASVYAKTYAEVKSKKQAAVFKAENDKAPAVTKKTICNMAYLANCFFEYHKQFIKDSSASRYYEIISNYIIPILGDVAVPTLNQEKVDKFINWLQTHKKADGNLRSTKTIRDIISVFKLIIKYAERNDYIRPLKLIYNLPKLTKNNIKVLDNNQRKTLEEFVCNKEDSYKFGVYLCLYTGLRIGELCALKWNDVDCSNSFLSVNKTILRITNLDAHTGAKTSIVINTPKTSSSIRIIPLPEALVKMIVELKHNKEEDSYLLTGSSKYIEPRIYYERYKGYLKHCDLEGYTFHTLRHTFATRCIESGIDPKVLSELLGHASVRITLDRYVHPSIDNKRKCLERLFVN